MSEQQQYQTREQIAQALNTAWRKHIVGQVPRHSLGPSAQDFVAGWESAVCALLPQPTPSAEPVDAAQAWDDGFEAGATWPQSTPSGVPVDPPINPYEADA